jgi:hypothetical protein
MNMLFVLLGAICAIGGLICWIIILVDAFKDALWKGFLSFCCYFYFLYYAFIEFDHEKKWPIVLGAIFLQVLGSVFLNMGGLMTMPTTP